MENYARNIESQYPDWQISDRNWNDYQNTPIQLPAIICTEFVADGMKHYRMAKWVDSHTISSFENHKDDSLCDKWLAPIDDGVKIRWDKPNYSSEDVAIIQTTDKKMNIDNQQKDSFDIHVWSDTDHTGIILTITETSNSSGIFEGHVFFTSKNKSQGTQLLVEDAVYAEHKFSVGSAKIIRNYEVNHHDHTWYLGKNLEKGDYFSYRLCHWDYGDCQEFQMDMWVDGSMTLEKEQRWTAQVKVTDRDNQVQGSIEFGKESAEPFGRNDSIKQYRNAFGSSVAWLASSTSETYPGSLAPGEFVEHDKWIQKGVVPHTFSVLDLEKVTVPAGSYDAAVLESDITPQNKIWIADSIPFPVKAKVYLDRVCDSGCPLEYEFDLLRYSKNVTYLSFVEMTSESHIEHTSPLKQFKNGISFHETKCNKGMQLTQKHDGSPACVSSETYFELIKRGWVSNAILAIQSRDVFVDPKDALSSYMGKVIPTLDDFKNVLSKPYDLDEIFSKFGEPHDDIGSGIHIYVYNLNDSTEIWIGYVDDIWYVKHVDSKGILIEELYEKPPEPEPERISDAETQLHDARELLQNAYQNHVNLGPYYMKDVVMGFGTYDGNTLVVDIASKYTDSDSFQTVKQEIRHIVNNDVNVDFIVYDEPIERHVETVIPYLWNKMLHQNRIDFTPKDQDYWNDADGFAEHDKVCSPLVASNGTEFFISSTFNLEPFEITGTYIDKIQPDGCHKMWKTDVLMPEPDRVTALWLENEN